VIPAYQESNYLASPDHDLTHEPLHISANPKHASYFMPDLLWEYMFSFSDSFTWLCSWYICVVPFKSIPTSVNERSWDAGGCAGAVPRDIPEAPTVAPFPTDLIWQPDVTSFDPYSLEMATTALGLGAPPPV
jgi:hypothetical protein